MSQPKSRPMMNLTARTPSAVSSSASSNPGELIHDRTGKLVSVHYQEQAYFEKFIMGSDEAEFVNKVKDSSSKPTEKNVERCRVR